VKSQNAEHIHVPKLAAGKYYWEVLVYWNKADNNLVNDYVIDIYSSQKIDIYKKGTGPTAG
jgi:hypothetical protein